MSKKRDTKVLLIDIQESIIKIQHYVRDYTYDSFINDDKTIDAVVRNFEIIGEATSKIDNDFKLINPQINWNDIKNLRNRLIHDYSGVDYELVWSIIENHLDELEFQITMLIQKI